MEDDYREILAELDNMDALLNELEANLEKEAEQEDEGDKWVCIDHSNLYCIFINRQGEERCIGAQYIEDCFGRGDQWP